MSGTDAGQRANTVSLLARQWRRHRLPGTQTRQPSQLGSQAGGHVDGICGGLYARPPAAESPGSQEVHGGVPERSMGLLL